jgi:pyruvate dehydrogenase E2 component (dihydrolipoamide acetyltransferase)
VASELTMPRLSDSMEEGTILKWLVDVGAEVRKGEPLVEIETDKANMTYDADGDGTLVEILAEEGDTLPVGRPIARIGDASDRGGREGAEADVESAAGDGQKRPAAGAKGAVEVTELTRLQQTVSRRMAESKATAPDYSLTVEVDMTPAVELRERLREAAEHPPSFNDMVVKASANALREHPKVSAGKITPPEVAGGTFTISNLGMYGIDEFTAVINPPQAAILTVGAVKKRPVVDEGGRVVARETMRLSLVSDHRILYGADAAEFLARVRELLEQPLQLAL